MIYSHLIHRRHFFQRAGLGVGALALGSLLREASAERVVLPVPESPKKMAQSPFGPTLAEACMGSTPRAGNTKLRYPNTDFLISPA